LREPHHPCITNRHTNGNDTGGSVRVRRPSAHRQHTETRRDPAFSLVRGLRVAVTPLWLHTN
jgi:hypothetical protein